MAADIFSSLPTDGYLFPSRSGGFANWSNGKHLLDKKLTVAPWTLHDLRRTFATNLAALNVPPHVVEKLLNHATGTISGVAAIYNRYQFMDEMRQAVNLWEKKLSTILTAT